MITQRLMKLIPRGHVARLIIFIFLSAWLTGCGRLVTIVTATLEPTAVATASPINSPTDNQQPAAETATLTPQVTKTVRPTKTPGVTRTPKATRTATRTPKPKATATRLPTTALPATLDGFRVVTPDDLPPEALDTLTLIDQGGPFPYRQDGVVFQNREGVLPHKTSNYYHEYTVITPGSPDRGARRIITGSKGELYYTEDHYATFVRIVRP